jgi:hypothetical protein
MPDDHFRKDVVIFLDPCGVVHNLRYQIEMANLIRRCSKPHGGNDREIT